MITMTVLLAISAISLGFGGCLTIWAMAARLGLGAYNKLLWGIILVSVGLFSGLEYWALQALFDSSLNVPLIR